MIKFSREKSDEAHLSHFFRVGPADCQRVLEVMRLVSTVEEVCGWCLEHSGLVHEAVEVVVVVSDLGHALIVEAAARLA